MTTLKTADAVIAGSEPWTTEKEEPFAREVRSWWTILLPGYVSVGLALILCLAAVALLGKSRDLAHVAAAVAVGAASLVTVYLSFDSSCYAADGGRLSWGGCVAHAGPDVPPFSPSRPPYPHLSKADLELFGWGPGWIPYDPGLLHRGTFVGLSIEEVEELLGPGPYRMRYPNDVTVPPKLIGQLRLRQEYWAQGCVVGESLTIESWEEYRKRHWVTLR